MPNFTPVTRALAAPLHGSLVNRTYKSLQRSVHVLPRLKNASIRACEMWRTYYAVHPLTSENKLERVGFSVPCGNSFETFQTHLP